MSTKTAAEDIIPDLIAEYRQTLLNDVVPFWMQYGLDKQYGGISNVCDDRGHALSHDKYLWSQGRALWTFSALYNRVERRSEWLAFAEHIFHYLKEHGRDNAGNWMYRLDQDGRVLERDISIYVDGFVLNGMGEYYKATGDQEAMKIALETYANTLQRIQARDFSVAPYAIPKGTKTHGVAMIFSFFCYNLGEIARQDDICQTGLRLAQEILHDFYVPAREAIVEFVSNEGKPLDTAEGRACVPGHALESLWFLISIFERAGKSDLIPLCCKLIKRHLVLGWDEEFGGLRLAIDLDGKFPPAWKNYDYKPWWVQVEALVATVYAYLYTHEPWCLEWHIKIHDYAFAHYPFEHGEWRQWLDRYGNPAQSAALPVKDPFHLPRGFIYLMDILGRSRTSLKSKRETVPVQ